MCNKQNEVKARLPEKGWALIARDVPYEAPPPFPELIYDEEFMMKTNYSSPVVMTDEECCERVRELKEELAELLKEESCCNCGHLRETERVLELRTLLKGL